jgi:hypothetical protein
MGYASLDSTCKIDQSTAKFEVLDIITNIQEVQS